MRWHKPWNDAARVEAMTPEQIFAPRWPKDLAPGMHSLPCDDEPGTWLRIMVEPHTGDVWIGASGAEGGAASARIRTLAGGGRNLRTHQALLWLALAMQLDRTEPLP
jgi:hypothetical protein